MDQKSTLDPAAELRRIAQMLTTLTPEAVRQAEAALGTVIEALRRWDRSADALFPWPSRELAVCRQLVVNSNQFWERRRTRTDETGSSVASQHWIG